ncbi:excisionase [Neisseria weixii]|uniref:excisionase n=1 Tax=Neisseria weixii TaxID=1853276 RepID=UPI0035A0D04F
MNLYLLKKYAEMSGYTENAIRSKINKGIWIEGRHYHRAPDRHIVIDVQEVEKWQKNQSPPA